MCLPWVLFVIVCLFTCPMSESLCQEWSGAVCHHGSVCHCVSSLWVRLGLCGQAVSICVCICFCVSVCATTMCLYAHRLCLVCVSVPMSASVCLLNRLCRARVQIQFCVASRVPGLAAATSTSCRSVCPRGAGRRGKGRGRGGLHLSTHPRPQPPLPQSRDRTLFRVAIRHLFSNLISSELYFPSLRKIIFHRSRSRPLPRTARRRLHISACGAGPGGREGGRRAARAEERREEEAEEQEEAQEAGRPRPGLAAPRLARGAAARPELRPQLPTSPSLFERLGCGVSLLTSLPLLRPPLCVSGRLSASRSLSDARFPARVPSGSVPPGLRASHPIPSPAPVPPPQDAAGAMAAGPEL